MLQAMAANIPNAIASSLDKAGQQMQMFAQAIVPVRTGHLRSTIAYSASEDELILSASASYAGYMEFGTRRMTPRPYLRPAFYAVLPQISSDIADAILQGF